MKTFIVFLWSVALTAAYAAPVKFDIPAQPASSAIQLFIKQSNTQVAYGEADLKEISTQALVGEHEPAAALAIMLKDSGYTAAERKAGWFSIGRIEAQRPGSIEGYVRAADSGRGVAGAKVAIAGTDKFVLTDKRGRFTFDDAPTGDQVLQITAEGMQNTKVTDVTVKSGHRLTLSSINVPVRQEGPLKLDPYVVSAKKNEGVVELDPYAVSGQRVNPFADANIDIPRTINDVQPYVIINARDIDEANVTNIEELLKQKLTMNASRATGAQLDPTNSQLGTTSRIDLRGLGSERTLILVNGRRMASVNLIGTSYQPDINGIPLSAIDRIEVLPTSASGIYGGNAMSGAVNIVLKRRYSGADVRVSYSVPEDSGASIKTASVAYGTSLGDGKTSLMLTMQSSDAKPLLIGDRRELAEQGYLKILKNNPVYLGYDPVTPTVNMLLGAQTNVRSTTVIGRVNGVTQFANLTLKSTGSDIGSIFATLPANFASNPNTIVAGLWNLDLPDTNQRNGLRRPITQTARTRALSLNVNREMNENLSVHLDGSYATNRSSFEENRRFVFGVLASSPVNPFNQNVNLAVPFNLFGADTTNSTTRSMTFGGLLKLPADFKVQADYTWSENSYSFGTPVGNLDALAMFNETTSGLFNPFADPQTLGAAISTRYLVPTHSRNKSALDDVALRAVGPVFSLPGGPINSVIALEYRKEAYDGGYSEQRFPVTVASTSISTFFPQDQVTRSAYAEVSIPVIGTSNALALVRALEIQAAIRWEDYSVSNGTRLKQINPDRTPPGISWSPFTPPGDVPYQSKARYDSLNSTLGLKFQPINQVTIRASYSTAFLPPTYEQLLPNPLVRASGASVNDPQHPEAGRYAVNTLSGGNPNLIPEESVSWNGGVVWEPVVGRLKGLRMSLDYYDINISNRIGSLSAQTLVTNESDFAGRIMRSPDTGLITQIDTSMLNLTRARTTGFDLAVDYRVPTSRGTLSLQAAATRITHVQRQNTLLAPLLDFVGWSNRSGLLKWKANMGATWETNQWTFSWSVRYFDSYPQNGAPGDPSGLDAALIAAQGSARVASQVYHDAFVSYAIKRSDERLGESRALLNGLTVQVGVKNIFGTTPPFDAFSQPYYYSYYGDMRLREYTLSIRKQF